MAAVAIIEAVSGLGQSAFDFFGKKQDGKNIKQAGLNDSFVHFEDQFDDPFANGQQDLLYGLFALAIVLIVAIALIKINQNKT